MGASLRSFWKEGGLCFSGWRSMRNQANEGRQTRGGSGSGSSVARTVNSCYWEGSQGAACLGTAVNLAGEPGQPSSCLTCGSIGQTEDKKHNNLLIQKFPGGQQAGEWEISWAEAATERGGKQPRGMERAGETLNHYISVSFPMKELLVMEELRRWPKCLDSFTLLLWKKAIYTMRLIVLTDQGNNKYRECIISCL